MSKKSTDNAPAPAIYLDHAASTPVRADVIRRMAEVMTEYGVNASSDHQPGRAAATIVGQAATAFGALIKASADSVVWTSGATESTNLALKGLLEFYGSGHIVSVVTEHHATLDTLAWLEKHGTRVTRLGVDESGHVDMAELAAAIADDTRCVSVMHVNNETGVIQDIGAIGALCAERNVVLHVDAAQSLGKLEIDVDAMHIGLLSVSAHKMGGPQGMGALYVRPRVGLATQIHGGGQQGNRRSGTLPLQQIVGFGRACELALRDRDSKQTRLRELNNRLWQGLAGIDGMVRNGSAQGATHILNVSIVGVHGAALLTGLIEGTPPLAVSSGSACSAARAESSYVLRAMDRDPQLAAAAVRFSLGIDTTTAAVDAAAARVVVEVARLRALAPRDLAWPA